VGTSASITALIAAGLQVQSTGANAYTSIGRWDNNAANPGLIFNKSRGGSVGTLGIVQANDNLAELSFTGDDGSAFVSAARIQAQVDGTPGTNDMPGRLLFLTTADGASSPTERMRITSAGLVGIGTGSPSSTLTVNGTCRIEQASSFAGINIKNNNDSSLSTTTSYLDATNNLNTVDGHIFFEHLTTGGSNFTVGTTPAGDRATDRRVTRLIVTSTGNVGIGTTAPSGKLQINIQDGFLFDVGAGAYTYMRFGSQATAEGVAELAFDRSTGAVALKTGNTGSTLNTRLSIDAAGATIRVKLVSPTVKIL